MQLSILLQSGFIRVFAATMHPALNIVTLGLLSLHLQRKEEKRAEKRAKAEAEAERLQEEAAYAEHCAEIERKYQAAQYALRAEEQRRRDAARQAKEQQEALEFSKGSYAYIAAHFPLLNTIMHEGSYVYEHTFGNGGSMTQTIPSSVLVPVFGAFWNLQAASSFSLCVKMDKFIRNEIWDSATAWGYYM